MNNLLNRVTKVTQKMKSTGVSSEATVVSVAVGIGTLVAVGSVIKGVWNLILDQITN